MRSSRASHVRKTLHFKYKFNTMEGVNTVFLKFKLFGVIMSCLGRVSMLLVIGGSQGRRLRGNGGDKSPEFGVGDANAKCLPSHFVI